MTREEIYRQCVTEVSKSNCLMMELATGYGKTKLSIDLVNHLVATKYQGKHTSMLLLVAKTVHKKTWKVEFREWGGINVDNVVIECYESLKKHTGEYFNFIVMDEVHHVKSDVRRDLLETLKYDYMFGLSATIPRNLKQYLRYKYHSRFVSCDIVEAIEDEVLPEPQILLFPLHLDNVKMTEEWEINAKVKGPIVRGTIKDMWRLKKQKVHAIISCTQKQKLLEYNKLIDWEKNKYMSTHREAVRVSWLYHSGKRLEYLAYCKNNVVSDILKRLSRCRTITFCKTIEQSEVLGKYCIHSQNGKADDYYDMFNEKRINHITAVNILNENANLVDCKYAVFANLSSSSIIIPQRLGRALRHKHPVIIVPYYVGTREQEIVEKMFEKYNKEFIKYIHSVIEI